MTIEYPRIADLICACGSTEIMCIDPGAGAEMDPVFDIVLKRPVPARSWCADCYAAVAAAMVREAPKRKRVARHGR